MKHTTKKGTEITFGNPEYSAGDPSPTIDGQIDLNAIRDKILGQ